MDEYRAAFGACRCMPSLGESPNFAGCAKSSLSLPVANSFLTGWQNGHFTIGQQYLFFAGSNAKPAWEIAATMFDLSDQETNKENNNAVAAFHGAWGPPMSLDPCALKIAS